MLEEVAQEHRGALSGLKQKLMQKSQMRSIQKLTMEVSDQHKYRLEVDSEFRSLTSALLRLCPDYGVVDDCLEYASSLSESMNKSPITADDALTLINRVNRYKFRKEPSAGDLLYFTQIALNALVNKCSTRNEFHGKLEELEDNVTKYNLDAGFYSNLVLKGFKKRWEIVDFDMRCESFQKFLKSCVKYYEGNIVEVDKWAEFLFFYVPVERQQELLDVTKKTLFEL
jgi:hypothetical protein